MTGIPTHKYPNLLLGPTNLPIVGLNTFRKSTRQTLRETHKFKRIIWHLAPMVSGVLNEPPISEEAEIAIIANKTLFPVHLLLTLRKPRMSKENPIFMLGNVP